MTQLRYTYEELRGEILCTYNGILAEDFYSATIHVHGLSFDENSKLRGLIQEFCRGKQE